MKHRMWHKGEIVSYPMHREFQKIVWFTLRAILHHIVDPSHTSMFEIRHAIKMMNDEEWSEL